MAFAVQARDELPQGLAQFHIHAGGGFVQHDDRRFVHQRLRDQHTPLHAARQLAHIVVGFVGQSKVFQQFIYPGVIAGDAEIAGLKRQGFAHAEKRIKDQLLRHYAQQFAHLLRLGLNVQVVHAYGTAAGLQ